MDLAYMPGELDYKNTKKGDPSSDIKREHDSVDDFEHLDPELSPSVDVQSKEFSGIEKFVAERDNQYEKLSDKDLIVTKPLIPDLSKDEPSTFNKPSESLTGNNSGSEDFMTDLESGSHIDSNFGVSNQEEPSLLDFVKDGPTISDKNHEVDLKNKSSFPAEKATDINKTEHESDLLNIESKAKDSAKNPQGIHSDDGNLKYTGENSVPVNKEMDFDGLAKSMKEADALSHYDMKPDRKGITKKDDLTTNEEYEPEPLRETHDPEPVIKTLPELIKPEPPVDITKPDKFESKPDPVKHNEQEKPKDEPVEIEDPLEVFIAICPSKPTSTASDLEENPLKEFIAICPSKPTSAVSDSVAEKNIKKMSVSDLDDIIGPEDVFKRIGLDAWFTPDRLHPIVEALVYWRDPKKSGVVFGGVMAILLSLCYMSLISVVAYSSLLALTGTICFRIYKNILQAVQKTSEGHPFKEFLDLELSLPQDKVREMADTAVVHVNAAIVELRRLFLVEDLIDSIKFGVCLWCLTYVGAIFNGMTLVILAFVALFTVPKVYENNKASIDTYVEMGRSRVAEITSKVKAAVPIGKKEPEKDKEQ